MDRGQVSERQRRREQLDPPDSAGAQGAPGIAARGPPFDRFLLGEETKTDGGGDAPVRRGPAGARGGDRGGESEAESESPPPTRAASSRSETGPVPEDQGPQSEARAGSSSEVGAGRRRTREEFEAAQRSGALPVEADLDGDGVVTLAEFRTFSRQMAEGLAQTMVALNRRTPAALHPGRALFASGLRRRIPMRRSTYPRRTFRRATARRSVYRRATARSRVRSYSRRR